MNLWTVFTLDRTQWCATQAEARDYKRNLIATGIKRNDITIQSAVVPTTSREKLSEWLNERDVAN